MVYVCFLGMDCFSSEPKICFRAGSSETPLYYAGAGSKARLAGHRGIDGVLDDRGGGGGPGSVGQRGVGAVDVHVMNGGQGACGAGQEQCGSEEPSC